MNRNRTILRQWLGAVLAAVIIAAAVPATAWAQTQTPVQQGVRAGNNTTTVNGTDVTAGQVVAAGRGTTVTVTTTDLTGESTPKVARVTVTKKEDFTATAATITGSETVNKNGTVTLTATVTPSFANTVVWTVDDATKAAFVSGETTATTVTAVVNPETGQATATLKGLEAGTVTVTVAATTSTTGTPISAEAKTLTVQNPATVTSAPTAVTKVLRGSSLMSLCSTGTASNGTMMYAVSTSNETAPETGWSNAVPKANHSALTAEGTYYVWYYVAPNDGFAPSEKQVTSAVAVNNERSESISATSEGSVSINGNYFTVQGTSTKVNNVYFLEYSDSQNITISQRSGQDKLISRVILKVSGIINGYSMKIPSYCTCQYLTSDNSNLRALITSNTDSIGSSISIGKNFPSGYSLSELAYIVEVYYY